MQPRLARLLIVRARHVRPSCAPPSVRPGIVITAVKVLRMAPAQNIQRAPRSDINNVASQHQELIKTSVGLSQ